MDSDGNGLTVGLFTRDSLDMDEEFQSVDGCDLAFAALVGSSDNCDFVVFSNGDAANLFCILSDLESLSRFSTFSVMASEDDRGSI